VSWTAIGRELESVIRSVLESIWGASLDMCKEVHLAVGWNAA